MEQFEARVLPASLSLGPAGLHRAEGGPATLQATLSQTQMMPVSGYFRTWPGTATENTDYTGTTSQSFTIPPGASFVNISIPALTDYSTEGDESFSVELLSAMGATIDPAAKIREVTIDDVVSGGGGGGGGSTTLTLSVPADVNEGEDFVLTAQLSPPGIYQINAMINWGATPGAGSAGFQGNTNPNGSFTVSGRYHDDGPAGNGTASDVQSITLTGTATQYTPQGPVSSPLSGLASTTIHNVDPTPVFQVYNHPILGGPWYKASGTFQDVGLADKGTLTIDWGDGSPPFIYPNMSVGTMIDPTHRYPPDGIVYTITMTMTDDDTGVASDDFSIALYLLDLDNDANNDEVINGFDESYEPPDPGPGRYIAVNNDDDNENEIPDMDENGPISGENNLEPFLIRWDGSMRPDINYYAGWHITLEAAFEQYEPYLLKPRIWFTPDKSPVSTDIDPDGDGELELGDLALLNLGFSGWGKEWTIGSPQPIPETLYLEARHPDGIPPLNLKLFPPLGGALPIEKDTVAFFAIDVVAAVNIVIFDGQNGRPVQAEETRGAFTVANINDTDGDEFPDLLGGDHAQNAGHKETPGFDEVDLMRLIIGKPPGYLLGTVLVLTVNPAASVRLWDSETRDNQVLPAIGQGEYHFTFTEFQIGVQKWVELLTPSGTLRDYTITAEYMFAAPDTVKATAVWGQLEAVEYDTRAYAAVFADNPWKEVPEDDSVRTVPWYYGGTGIRPATPDGEVVNVILFQWTPLPEGIEKEPGVLFDETRRHERKTYYERNDGSIKVATTNTDWPEKLDYASDDDFPDGSYGPNDQGHMFQKDAPGPTEAIPDLYRKYVFTFNAEEFLRVSFIGFPPEGNGVKGSRCSQKFSWHSRTALEKVGGIWGRVVGVDANNKPLNHIGPGFLNTSEFF